MLNWLKRNKILCFIVGGAILTCAVLLCIFLIPKDDGEANTDTPTLTVETPQKLSISGTDTFVLDVTVSSFGDAIYPAVFKLLSCNIRVLLNFGVQFGPLVSSF